MENSIVYLFRVSSRMVSTKISDMVFIALVMKNRQSAGQ